MVRRIKKKKTIKERKTKVGDLIIRNNSLFKVVRIKKDKEGRMLELKPF